MFQRRQVARDAAFAKLAAHVFPVIKPLLYVNCNDIVITTGEVLSEVSLIAGLLDSTIGQAGTAPPENYNNQNSRTEGNPRNPLSEGPPLPPKPCDATTISSC